MKGTMLADVAESLEAARDVSLKVGTLFTTYTPGAHVQQEGPRTRPFLAPRAASWASSGAYMFLCRH